GSSSRPRPQSESIVVLWIGTAVPIDAADAHVAFERRAEFHAHHGQSTRRFPDLIFAEVDHSEVRHVDHVPVNLQLGSIVANGCDQRTRYGSLRLWRKLSFSLQFIPFLKKFGA